MNSFKFSLDDADSLIRIDAQIGRSDLTLALDTGATHTVIDLTLMLLNGYDLSKVVRTVEFETAKGPINAYVFRIDQLTALGKTVRNVEVSSYDFIGNNVIFDIDGVLGLDFFKESELIINFKNHTISLL
ncbi:aspartyl protease family protein [Fibrella aquatica]|jgi:Aspartyl protease|uniref:aspartyl protease family protein n=1 Tax=Fibrella aquatica TaxID=3242487 RepID=UPI0035201B3B